MPKTEKANQPAAFTRRTKGLLIGGSAILAALIIVLIVLSVIPLGGTSGVKGDDPNVGKYMGYQIDVLGWEPMESVYDAGENYIELKSGGKGAFCLEGEETQIQWVLDGENLTMSASGQTCTGTLKDGLITTDYFGMDMTLDTGDTTILFHRADDASRPVADFDSDMGEEMQSLSPYADY